MIKTNIITVDLEDYYCDHPLSDWNKYETRVVSATRTVLSLLARYEASAAFFTVRYIAEKHLGLIEENYIDLVN